MYQDRTRENLTQRSSQQSEESLSFQDSCEAYYEAVGGVGLAELSLELEELRQSTSVNRLPPPDARPLVRCISGAAMTT